MGSDPEVPQWKIDLAGIELVEGLTIMGMDPSSFRNCGWAVVRFEGGAPVLTEKFTQRFEMDENDPARYRELYDGLAAMIAKHKPAALALERSMGAGLMFVRNNLSETVGVAKLCCHDNGVRIHEVSPSHLKKIIAGHGKAKKQHIKANVAATFGLKKSGVEHECDAVACAMVMLVDLGWPGYTVKVPFSK